MTIDRFARAALRAVSLAACAAGHVQSDLGGQPLLDLALDGIIGDSQ